MSEYINRDEFIKHKRFLYCENCSHRKNGNGKIVYEIGDAPCRACGIGDVLDDVEDFPAADVVERRRGEWIDGKVKHIVNGEIRPAKECSKCGASYFVYDNYNHVDEIPNYCPNCGAQMSEEVSE